MESFLETNITLFSENKTASCKKKEIFHGPQRHFDEQHDAPAGRFRGLPVQSLKGN